MKPEEAIERARDVRFGEDLSGFSIEPTDRLTAEQIMGWAVIETDIEHVRSTRLLGAPITWLKRRLVHMMRQELGQAYAQQSRFNLMVVTRLAELEERVERLEGGSSPR